jgi:hypothetical protein
MLRALMRTAGLLLVGLTLASSPALADTRIYIGTAPPPPIIEVRHVSPHRGYVWRPGYHHWNGHRYIWTRGSWVRPPYRNARWSEGRWSHERRGWYWVPGHWARG